MGLQTNQSVSGQAPFRSGQGLLRAFAAGAFMAALFSSAGYAEPAEESRTDLTGVAPADITAADLVRLLARPRGTHIRSRVSLPIQFAFDKAELLSDAKRLLSELSQALQRDLVGRAFALEGYTCSMGARNRNQTLSMERAIAVRKFLVSLGVSPETLVASGHGASNFIRPDTTDPRNRRVDVVTLKWPK